MEKEPKLGRLERVDLRGPWPREDTAFTPWLAQAENLKLLGESIGMDLELLETEARVGPFRADVLCKDIMTDSFVLVENQLEPTDHTHLGQLMTYAAGLDTVHVVWVSQRFNEEHRAALDWLNRITMEGFHFFGVEIELWKIGNSLPAPKFNVVCKPNDWQKAARASKQAVQSENAQLYRNLWSSMIDYLRPRFQELNFPKPTGMRWIRFIMPGTHATVSYAAKQKALYIYLLFKGHDPVEWFNYAKANFKDTYDLKWVDRGEDSFAQWETVFDHEDEKLVQATFQEVGKTLAAINVEITACFDKFSNQTNTA